MNKILVKDLITNIREDEFISLTDIARYKNPKEHFAVIKGWLRTIDTISFLGLWEQMKNPKFKPVEFDRFKRESGMNFYINADVHILEVIILIIGILFYVHSGIVTYINNKRKKEEE